MKQPPDHRGHVVVTGVAGFIGSHLAEALLGQGWDVVGIDAFTGYYATADKWSNLAGLLERPGFELVRADLATVDVLDRLQGAAVVFHQAAQPGVRTSWGREFAGYVHHNVLATQRLLESCVKAAVPRLILASSSSVYGNAPNYPTTEDTMTRPVSPYGVSKLAAEHLCLAYADAGMCSMRVAVLRYFTVYGPRQRPDMAMRKLCEALLDGASFPMFGDGSQSRDFTHVADAVDATFRAALAEDPAAIYNVGGGHEATLAEIVALLEDLSGREVALDRRPEQAGDVRRTAADTTRAAADLGWRPSVGLREGLRSQLDWVIARRRSLAQATGPVADAPTPRRAAARPWSPSPPGAARTGAARS
jgi:UDP-glucuronate 4-epimerase